MNFHTYLLDFLELFYMVEEENPSPLHFAGKPIHYLVSYFDSCLADSFYSQTRVDPSTQFFFGSEDCHKIAIIL